MVLQFNSVRFLGRVRRLLCVKITNFNVWKQRSYATRKRGRPRLKWQGQVVCDLKTMRGTGWGTKVIDRSLEADSEGGQSKPRAVAPIGYIMTSPSTYLKNIRIRAAITEFRIGSHFRESQARQWPKISRLPFPISINYGRDLYPLWLC